MKRIILLVCMLYVQLCAYNQSSLNYGHAQSKIMEFIKDDYFNRFGIPHDSMPLHLSNTKIEFHLSSIVEGVIFKVDNNSFNQTGVKEVKYDRLLIDSVTDSLRNVSDRLNSLCSIGSQPRLSVKECGKCAYVFFSNRCENKIYVEVVPGPPSIILNGGGYDIYGAVNTYLFELKGANIVEIYKGNIDYN